jgi:hypothetical protein
MNRFSLLLVTGTAWAVMMGLLFEREVRPYFQYLAPPTYETIFKELRKPEYQRRAVIFAGSRIGDSESISEPQEGVGARMQSRLSMRMGVFGGLKLMDDRALMSSEFRVGLDHQLREFRLDGNFQGVPVTARGERQGGQLRLSYNLVITKGDLLVPFPKDATLSDSFLPYQGGGRLETGKKWKIRMFDLGNLVSLGKDRKVELTELYATVVGRERPPGRPDGPEAWQIEVRKDPTEEIWSYLIWVDERGTVLEQHMKINKLLCKIVLEERRDLSPAEAKEFPWRVPSPR